jgi:hypothetical protein
VQKHVYSSIRKVCELVVLEHNQLHTEDRPLSLLDKLHDKDYYDKGAFLGRLQRNIH